MAAVAHELNNVLTVIRTYTHFARQPTTAEQCAHDLRLVAAAAERAAALADWLASQGEVESRADDTVSANEFVSMVSARLQGLFRPGTVLEIMREGDDVQFLANALRLEHALVATLLAASQGWTETALRVAVDRAVLVAGERVGLAAGPYAVLSITCDNAKDSLAWNAEPHSSNDELSVLIPPFDDLLRTMRGKLELTRSERGARRLVFYLPATLRDVSQPQARLALAPPSVHTICVIENESAIRQAMVRSLAAAGQLVLDANSGVAARELLVSQGRAVSLLLCDVGLVQEDEEFFAWVRATCPNAALLLISGDEPRGQAKASSLRTRFLAKPFTPVQLLGAVNDTLAEADARRSGRGPKRMVVLIVDDDPALLDSFRRLLAESDFDTLLALDGQSALRILAEERVDAVVSDLLMPGMSGIELLERVRQSYPECARVLCIGQVASVEVERALERGDVQCVLSKSLHAVALREKLERAIVAGVGRG